MPRRIALVWAVGLALAPLAVAQPRTHIVTEVVTVVVPVIGADNAPQVAKLDEKLRGLAEKGEFKSDAPQKRFTFALKLNEELTWTDLKAGVEGEEKLFVLGDPTLVGKVRLAFDPSVTAEENKAKLIATSLKIKALPGMTAFRPTGTGGIEMVVAAPGFPVSQVRDLIVKSLTIPEGTDPIAEVTWYGPIDPDDPASGVRKHGGGGSKKK